MKNEIESNYHAMCNGGHEIIIDREEIKVKNCIKLINKLIESNIGYISFK